MTPEQRARFLVVHKSDATCLAKLHAKLVDGIDVDNGPRRVGSACAHAAEALAYEAEDELSRAEMFRVAKAAILEVAGDLLMTPEDIAEACSTMAGAIGTDAAPTRLRFGKPTGWESAAEWKWALDRNFKPVPFDDPRAVCAGTIDLVMWKEDEGKVRVIDDKATKGFQGHDDLQGFEAWLYAMAAIEVFGVRSAWFGYRNLRAAYLVGEDFRAGEPWHETVKSIVLARRADREVAVEMNEFPETLGPDCKWCPIIHRCGAQKAAAKDGRKSSVTEPADLARRYLALKAMTSVYEDAVKGIVSETQAPIDLGGGLVYGLKPVPSWRLSPRFDGPDGRERLMRMLRDYRMTDAQEAEWFGYVADSGLASAVKTAIHELLGHEAGKFLNDVSVSPIEPMTKFENSAWLPATGKRAASKAIDEATGEIDW